MTGTERYVEIGTGRTALSLVNCDGIQFGETLITPAMLEGDTQEWRGNDWPGHLNLRKLGELVCGKMPLIIIGDSAGPPLKLRAELVKFPPSQDLRWPSDGVRLVPSSGRIAKIVLDRSSSLTINHVERSPEFVAFDLGNGSLHLEVYYNEQGPETLPPLTPPVFS